VRFVSNVRFVSTVRIIAATGMLGKAHNRCNRYARYIPTFGLATPRCVASLFAPRMRKTADFA